MTRVRRSAALCAALLLVSVPATAEVDVPRFQPDVYIDLATGWVGVRAITLAVNDDARPDIAYQVYNAQMGARVGWLINLGDGTFEAHQPGRDLPSGYGPMEPGDVNGDGRPDLVVVAPGQFEFFTTGAGGGLTAGGVVPFDFPGSPTSVKVADVNGDGRGDLVIASCSCFDPNPPSLFLKLNQGNGTFASAAPIGAGMLLAHKLRTADLNGDGHLDIVANNRYRDGAFLRGANEVSVWLGDGSGLFSRMEHLLGASLSIALGDMDDDGRPDLIRAGQSTNSYPQDGLAFHHGNGDGTFGPKVVLSAGDVFNLFSGPDISTARAQDFGPPIIAGTAGSLNNGAAWVNGAAFGLWSGRVQLGGSSGDRDLVIADLNGDAKLDVVATEVARLRIQLQRAEPVARAGLDRSAPVGFDALARVTLDGGASSGSESYAWRSDGSLIGTGATLQAALSPGIHPILLTVTAPTLEFESTPATHSDLVVIQTTAPSLTPQELVSQVGALENRLAQLEARPIPDISSLQAQVTQVQGQVSGIASDIGVLFGLVGALNTRVSALEGAGSGGDTDLIDDVVRYVLFHTPPSRPLASAARDEAARAIAAAPTQGPAAARRLRQAREALDRGDRKLAANELDAAVEAFARAYAFASGRD